MPLETKEEIAEIEKYGGKIIFTPGDIVYSSSSMLNLSLPDIKYEKIHNAVRQVNLKLIKEVSLFDVYKGDKLPENKKSYGIAFKILDNEKTLSEEIIEELMDKIISKLKKEFKAELR